MRDTAATSTSIGGLDAWIVDVTAGADALDDDAGNAFRIRTSGEDPAFLAEAAAIIDSLEFTP